MAVLHMKEEVGESDLSIYSLVKQNVNKYGNCLAFQDEEKEYSWKETLDILCKMAYVLSVKGITRESKVLLVINKTMESTLLLYSLLLLGSNVFITNSHTCERSVVGKQHIDVVIGNELKIQINSPIEIWSIRSILEEGIQNENVSIDYSLFENNDAATFIVLFTSGTLGEAKGIQLGLHSYLKNAHRFAQCLCIKNIDKYCLVTPLHHCFGIINIFSALTKGACIFFPSSKKYDVILCSINRYKCTVLNAVPTIFLGLQKSVHFDKKNVASIQKGVMAGGNYSVEQFIDITNNFQMNLLSSYGLTECCATVTFSSYEDDLEEKAYGVGRFIPGVSGSIQDSCGNELPVMNCGEICVKGYSLMKGYYDNGNLLYDFVDTNGWFHTGDLGYIDSKNNLHIVDRIKSIIICGGENISPKKIEDTILQLSFVDECAVVGIEDKYYGEIPCAVIKSSDLMISNGKEYKIRSYLEETLEKFEIPRKILVVDAIPVNENGKYDKASIRRLFH